MYQSEDEIVDDADFNVIRTTSKEIKMEGFRSLADEVESLKKKFEMVQEDQ